MQVLFLLGGCSENPQPVVAGNTAGRPLQQPGIGRWYDSQQVTRGASLYQTYCAECHLADASGTLDWRTPDAAGKYPPPPLNGSAHTWHHSLEVLRRTVKLGGVRLGGTMPGFEGRLDAREIDDIIAWIQSNWSQEIYSLWSERDRD